MHRSPQRLRSGQRGKPVLLQKKTARPLSVSTSPASSDGFIAVSSMAPHQSVREQINEALSGGEFFDKLVKKLTDALKPAIEAAVQAALASANAEISELREEVAKLQTKVSQLDSRLEDRTDELEQYQRRNNIRIFGVKESAVEKTDDLVIGLCREKLGLELPASSICRSHRVGYKGEGETARPRPIIVKFTSYQARRMVFVVKKKLKGTGITIREDLTRRRLDLYREVVSRHGMDRTWSFDGRVCWLDKDGVRGTATRMADL